MGAVGIDDLFEPVVLVPVADLFGALSEICRFLGGDVAVGVVGVHGLPGVGVVDRKSVAQKIVRDGGGVFVDVGHRGDLAHEVVAVGGGDVCAVVVLDHGLDPVVDVAETHFDAFARAPDGGEVVGVLDRGHEQGGAALGRNAEAVVRGGDGVAAGGRGIGRFDHDSPVEGVVGEAGGVAHRRLGVIVTSADVVGRPALRGNPAQRIIVNGTGDDDRITAVHVGLFTGLNDPLHAVDEGDGVHGVFTACQ